MKTPRALFKVCAPQPEAAGHGEENGIKHGKGGNGIPRFAESLKNLQFLSGQRNGAPVRIQLVQSKEEPGNSGGVRPPYIKSKPKQVGAGDRDHNQGASDNAQLRDDL